MPRGVRNGKDETTWMLVAAVYNLEVSEGMREGPFITAQQARRACERGLRRMRRELAKQGVTAAEFDAYLRMKDRAEQRYHDNLEALLPAPTRVVDEADPDRKKSLRQVAS